MSKICDKYAETVINFDYNRSQVSFVLAGYAERYSCILQLLKSNKYPSIQDIIDLLTSEYGNHKDFKKSRIQEDFQMLKGFFQVPIKYSRAHKGYYLSELQWDKPLAELANIVYQTIVKEVENTLNSSFEDLFGNISDDFDIQAAEDKIDDLDKRISKLEAELNQLASK